MEILEGGKSEISLFVNGREVRVKNPDPELNLLYFLRDNSERNKGWLSTVMVSKYDAERDQVHHMAVNACLAPLCSMDGLAVTTTEGIGSTQNGLHPCQERIAKAHGSQCGFCTPGMVMSMYTLLRNNALPSQREMENAFQGNLCRCTGYRAILEGYKTFTKEYCCGGKCCKERKTPAPVHSVEGPAVLFDASSFAPLDPTQEPIFPPALKLGGPPVPLALSGPRVRWFRPTTLQQLLALRERFPHYTDPKKPKYRVIVGNTQNGLERRFKNAHYEILISAGTIPELCVAELREEGLWVGAAVSLSQLVTKLEECVGALPEYQTRTFAALLEVLNNFAGQQIRNVASVRGNMMAARPTALLAPLLMTVGARLTVASKDASRPLFMDSSFYVGQKQTVLQPNEVLISVLIPLTRKNEYVYGHKQAQRHDNDTAFVNTGMQVLLEERRGQWLVKECNIGCSGMASCPLMAAKTQKSLIGKPWSESTLEEASSLLLEDFPLQPDSPGGRAEYRQSLLISFFFKFYLRVLAHVHSDHLPTEMLSAIEPFSRPPIKSSQGFQTVPGAQLSHDAVGRPMMHLSAFKQATGEARYIDDIPHIEGELYGAVVLSEHSHAMITVDASEAEQLDGVRAFISVSDVTGSNITGPGDDEEVFADGKVIYAGQLVGMVVAETRMQARRAAKAVNIIYEDLQTVLTNEEAIAADQFFSVVRHIESGDVDSALSSSDHVIEGQMHVGGQEHYYMETSSCLVVPRGEDGEMEVFSSTQGLKETQMFAAKALGVPANRVVVRVKRIGGGFGGKETRTTFLTNAVALAAQKLKAPIRSVLDQCEDMMATGKRHPLLAKYKVGFTKESRLTALAVELYINGGAALDLSVGVIERAMQHSENCYKVPNVCIVGKICKTNLPPNTAFRGYGGPQGMLVAEHWIHDVAAFLRLPADKVREMNLYSLDDITPYGHELDDCQVRRCWEMLMGKASYKERRAKVDSFNKHNHWKKRGLAIIPTKYGVCFGRTFLNQGGALVHVYTDGSVLLTHGGMEMGQGLHTKMIQVCARCLDIPTEKIHITETATNCVANASPTAASVSCDLNGMAIKLACDQLIERLAQYKKDSPEAGWEQWVMSAYMDRVNLTAQGFYKTPGIWFDWTKGKGRPFNYTTYGASCTEVEVDSLTGGWQALRSDLLMDVGDSINPALDIGQVEGAFTQGMGLFTMEEYVYLEGNGDIPRGYPVPREYKIPAASNIPAELNCSLLDRTPNPKAIFSSKAVGEPPLLLAASVFFALKDAIAAVRAESDLQGPFPLDSPATVERIRMACVDRFTKKVNSRGNSGTSLKWNVAV